jgi:lipopolysaccharide/colanic/teichoic acid biosynthesis glycosyltransferase
MNNILSKYEFLTRLRIEKRRVDRSKAALSIAIFRLQKEITNDKDPFEELLIRLHHNTRETDIKGWVSHNVIGLILPDTDEKGIRCFTEKILNGDGYRAYSVVSATYPHDLFNKLLPEKRERPDLFPIDLDESVKAHRVQAALKRIMDMAGSVFGLLLASPLMLATAFVIKISSPGPAIFKQIRLGKKGARFPFYKFRSMYWNADERIHREYVADLIEGNLVKINQGDAERPIYKMKSDPRITLIGNIIRRTNIDELPQFFNVLKGEMSLVGPRPPIPYEVEKYQSWHLRRILEVKPGITGLWQVDGRSRTSFDDMVRLDLKYAQNWSLWLDIKILLKTVGALIRPQGAL